MAIRTIGSQNREPINETEYRVAARMPGEHDVILFDDMNFELWTKRDDFSGYVIEIDGVGYEFVRDASVGELWWAGINDKPQDVILTPM